MADPSDSRTATPEDSTPGRHDQRRELLERFYAKEVAGRYELESPTPYQQEIIQGIEDQQSSLDELITEQLDDWRLERVHPIERVLLRLGCYEIRETDTNKAIVIDEAVELAKEFGDDRTPDFVNGILDNFNSGKVDES